MESSTGSVAEVGAGDPMLLAAAEEVKTLGGCCKDSDRVLEKINSEHEKLSKQGVTHPLSGGACFCRMCRAGQLSDMTLSSPLQRLWSESRTLSGSARNSVLCTNVPRC